MLGSNEATLTLVLKAKNAASKELGGLGKSLNGLTIGFAAAAGAAAFMTGVLVDSISKAIEEQKNIAKLNAALKANVAGFDGGTASIERTITAREELAFSDDELRNSLALLVAATHNVGQAFTIQQTAMDLARLKGISLEDATTALIRVEGGQYRALKGLGIVLKEGATQQEALTAVQAVAEGQAKAYATTISAKLEVAQIHLNDAQENAASVILPGLADMLDKLTLGFKAVTGNLDQVIRLTDALALANSGLTASYRHLATAEEQAAAKMKDFQNAPIGHKQESWLDRMIKKTAALGGNYATAASAAADLQNAKKHNASQNPGVGHAHAAGGWVGLNGPEIALVGEKGPEYIVPNHQLGGGSMSGVTIVGVSERQILDMVERGLYFRLQRAAPTRSAV